MIRSVPVFRSVMVSQSVPVFQCSGVPECSGLPGFSTCRDNWDVKNYGFMRFSVLIENFSSLD